MNHKHVHAVVEMVDRYGEKTHKQFEKVEERFNKVEHSLKAVHAIAASEAFRKYDWIKDAPIRNTFGDFRGMVISKRWASIFHIIEKADHILKPIEKVLLVAGIADNIFKARQEIATILASQDSSDFKAARLSAQVSSVLLRTVASGVPASAELLATILGGYCQIAGLAGSKEAIEFAKKLQTMSVSVNTTFEKITDGDKIYLLVNGRITFSKWGHYVLSNDE